MRRSVIAGLCVVTMILAEGVASAAVFTEGFEGFGYNLINGTIVTAPAPVHSGNQSLDLTIANSADYARVKLDVSSLNLTLGQITSADYWVNKSDPAAEQAPYILFSIVVPGQSVGYDSTLAVMYNNPGVTATGWQDVSINTNQLFHVEGDTIGLTNPSSITLADLDASTYSPGVTWGSLLVDYVRIGYGQGGNDGVGAQTAYVDDLSINYTSTSGAIPEPATIIIWSLLGGLGIAIAHRQKRAA